MKNIHKKLEALRSEIGAIEKGKTNPFHKSKYFDINILLDHLDPLLGKYHLLLLQPIIGERLYTRLIDTETGEEEGGYMDMPAIEDPQKMGSVITYFRRYSLQSLLALRAEDDDGNEAVKDIRQAKNWLTKQQFDKTCLGTHKQIDTVLKNFRMKKEYRVHLEGLLHQEIESE